MPRETQQGSVGKGHDVGCQRVRSADAGPDQRRTRGEGNDTLLGDPGDDWIDGGTGADTLSGGSGADSFVFRNGDGKERVIDFVNDLDTLVFAGGHWDGAMSIKSFVSTYARTLRRFGDL